MLEFNANKCPRCGSTQTYWRHGLHFDHLRRCSDCQKSYDPADEHEKYLEAERDRLSMVTYKE